MSGTLYIVSTPIGHLEDLSPRARSILETATVIACEDTRRTGQLLSLLGLPKRALVSLHEHNERRRVPDLLQRLEGGELVALVSDAGTPLLSDPGFLLVREAARRGLPIVPVPGPSACLAALVASGLPAIPFTFAGFPPRRSGRRRRVLGELVALPHTVVLYESPHRIIALLGELRELAGDRPAAVARELTKRYEEILRGPLSELEEILASRTRVRGEIVVVLAGTAYEAPDEAE